MHFTFVRMYDYVLYVRTNVCAYVCVGCRGCMVWCVNSALWKTTHRGECTGMLNIFIHNPFVLLTPALVVHVVSLDMVN